MIDKMKPSSSLLPKDSSVIKATTNVTHAGLAKKPFFGEDGGDCVYESVGYQSAHKNKSPDQEK